MSNNLTLQGLIKKLPVSNANSKNRHMITISFDDGYETDYSIVFPIFKELGFRGTFFQLPSDITSEQMREMSDAGQEIATHGLNHIPYLVSDSETVTNDMLGGKKKIEDIIGKPVLTIAYPYGGGDAATGMGTAEDMVRVKNIASGIYESARGTIAYTNTYNHGNSSFSKQYTTPYGAPDGFNVPCHLADQYYEVIKTLVDDLLTIQEGGWLNVAFHRIYKDDDTTKPANRLNETTFRSIVSYIADKQKAGLLDVVPFYEGARRIKTARSSLI